MKLLRERKIREESIVSLPFPLNFLALFSDIIAGSSEVLFKMLVEQNVPDFLWPLCSVGVMWFPQQRGTVRCFSLLGLICDVYHGHNEQKQALHQSK